MMYFLLCIWMNLKILHFCKDWIHITLKLFLKCWRLLGVQIVSGLVITLRMYFLLCTWKKILHFCKNKSIRDCHNVLKFFVVFFLFSKLKFLPRIHKEVWKAISCFEMRQNPIGYLFHGQEGLRKGMSTYATLRNCSQSPVQYDHINDGSIFFFSKSGVNETKCWHLPKYSEIQSYSMMVVFIKKITFCQH